MKNQYYYYYTGRNNYFTFRIKNRKNEYYLLDIYKILEELYKIINYGNIIDNQLRDKKDIIKGNNLSKSYIELNKKL